MPDIWVCKDDGTIQCQKNPEITLDDMRKRLARLIGEDNILDQEKRSRIVARMCGIPTGRMNAYKLTKQGEYELFHGFSGPDGFRRCGESADSRTGVTPEAPEHATQVLVSGRFTSALSTPVLIRELIGRPLRVYRAGDPITGDYQPDRTNIEIDKAGTILEIWFG